MRAPGSRVASRLHRGDTGWKFLNPEDHGSQHCASLFFAVVTLVMALWDLVAHALLLDYYFETDHMYSGGAIVAAYLVASVIHSLFDYLNRGRLWCIPLDLLQVRVVAEFVEYVREWRAHRGDSKWSRHEFRSAVGFEAFLVAYFSQIIQALIILGVTAQGYWTWINKNKRRKRC